jgi:hypothetical protein
MQSRLATASLRDSGVPADFIERVEIVEPKTATEPTCQRIKFEMGKEFQGKITPLQNHPNMISPTLSKAQRSVKLRRPFEIARRQVWRCTITHERSPNSVPSERRRVRAA